MVRDIVPIEITGVNSGKVDTRPSFPWRRNGYCGASQYVESLREQHVIVDVSEREQLIVEQINGLS